MRGTSPAPSKSAAATGGQITPPIMGAAAFLMVEYLAVPYQTIILAAIVPAFMHFFGVFCQIHFEAKKHGLRGLPRSELPVAREVIRRDWPTAMPLAVLLIVLFSDFTPYLAAFWGITGCIVLGLTNRNPVVAIAFVAAVALCIRLQILTEWSGFGSIIAASIALSAWYGVKDEAGKARFIDMLDAFVVGAKYAISVGAAAATVGIIIGIVTLTGVGFKLSTIITGAAADLAALFSALVPSLFDIKAMTLFFTLVMTAIVCILLGCGIPTTANYLIMVTIAAPALAMLGVPQLVSHFFVFYYGVLADITPPVALAAYAGASMAGADPFKTGNTAFRLGLAKALVPFVFVYSPVDADRHQGIHLGGVLRDHHRLHHRHRHARRRAHRLWPRAHAELRAALARRCLDPGDLAEPHRDADRPCDGGAGADAPARGLAGGASGATCGRLTGRRSLFQLQSEFLDDALLLLEFTHGIAVIVVAAQIPSDLIEFLHRGKESRLFHPLLEGVVQDPDDRGIHALRACQTVGRGHHHIDADLLQDRHRRPFGRARGAPGHQQPELSGIHERRPRVAVGIRMNMSAQQRVHRFQTRP